MYRILIVLCIFLAGCTEKLWEPKPMREMAVNGFYVNKETNDFVVTTRHQAFLFTSQPRLGQALMLSREVEFLPEFVDFSLSSANEVTGSIRLKLHEQNPSTELVSQLTTLGFRKLGTDSLQSVWHIRGERYTIERSLPLEKLDKEYAVRISMPRGPIDTAGRVIATPSAIIFDTAVTVVAIPFVAIALAALAYEKSK